MSECRNCSQGQIAIGEHFVSHEMALDGCMPELEGASMGIEWGICQCCGGNWQDCPNCANDALLAERNALKAKLEMAKGLLERLSHWDMLWTGEGQPSLVADGPYWKREIDETLQKLEEN